MQSRGSKVDIRLFPHLRSEKDQVTGSWGKWFGRYARDYVAERNKSFHSFRHLFKRNLRNASLADNKTLRDALMGHDTGDVAESYGLDESGHGFALPLLKKAIDELRYDGLVITMAPAQRRGNARKAATSS